MKVKKELHAHSYVADFARDLCLANYEVLMSDNLIRESWKNKHVGVNELGLQAAFIKRFWATHVQKARAMLAEMLSTCNDEELKKTIHEILVLDNSLEMGRNSKRKGLHNVH